MTEEQSTASFIGQEILALVGFGFFMGVALLIEALVTGVM